MNENLQYFEELEQKAEALNEQEKKLSLTLITMAKNPYYRSEHQISEITSQLEAMANGSENLFFQPLIDVTRALLGEYPASVFQYILEHKREYSYSVGYNRRPFRTSNIKPHIEGIIRKLVELIAVYQDNFSIMDVLTTRNSSYQPGIISDILAYEIDHNPEKVTPALKEIIYGDNNTAFLSTTIIRGIFLSHHHEFYKMMGELLIAARLQEGLRQSIVESMDEGTLEATKYMLPILLEHDLIRYSSVVRALGVWTGLNLEANNTRVVKQCIEYAYRCLTEEELRNQWMGSQDVNKLYISLWATAVTEEQEVEQKIQYIMENGETYQKIVAQSFLTQSQNEEFRFSMAQRYLEQEDVELQYFIFSNYIYECRYEWDYTQRNSSLYMKIIRIPLLEDKQERMRQFTIFSEALTKLNKKELTFSSFVFDGLTITYSADLVVNKLMYLIAYDMDPQLIAQLISFQDLMSTETRKKLLEYFVLDEQNQEQREYIFASLTDKSMAVRETTLSIMMEMDLHKPEIEKIEQILKLKTGSLRQNAIHILMKLNMEKLEGSVDRLLQSKDERQRLGALEILTELREDQEQANLFHMLKSKISSLKNPTEKEKILLAKLTQTEEDSLKNGFGLFDPKENHSFLDEIKENRNFTLRNMFTDDERIKDFFFGLSELIHEHRDYEYEREWYDGSKETFLLGTRLDWLYSTSQENVKELDHYPLSELWRDYLKKSGLSSLEYIQALFYLSSDRFYSYYSDQLYDWEMREIAMTEGWKKSFLDDIYPMEQIKEMDQWLKKLDYAKQIHQIMFAYWEEYSEKEIFSIVIRMLNGMIHSIPEDKLEEEKSLLNFLTFPWLNWVNRVVYDDFSFKTYFILKFKLYKLLEYKEFRLTLEETLKAYALKIIDQNEVYKELMVRDGRKYNISQLTSTRSKLVQEYPFILPIKEKVINKILEIELQRGDLPTELTVPAMGIEYFEGMEDFVAILSALDKESFVRGYIFSYGEQLSKKEALSYLLKACHPQQEDDEKLLKQLLQGKKITEARLLEAAMYAPQWLDIVAKHLKWEGLRSAAWYFHAHINETFSAEKETIVAHYSSVSPKDFYDGAFDIEWFKEAYNQLGEERFQILYRSAKYISGGANHRRSQLFADAVLGRLDLGEVCKSVKEKRNKDHLLCYTLIPLRDSYEQDVLERYEFLQKFLLESKAFGAQRRTSESRTVSIALANLARNAGYKDVIRLTWDMEAKKMKEVYPFLQPKEVDDLTVQLVIHPDGMPEIKVMKQSKELKSIPSKYKNHEYIVQLKELKISLKNQYKRARTELERSMEMESTFTLFELHNMIENPVISPLLQALVLKVGEHLGYYKDGVLESAKGKRYPIDPENEIYIAHPVHLYESGEWSSYQRDLFDRKVKQPFKQVFRELYLPNADERAAGTISRRYAGHQVQPRKTAALLKSRMWTVSYEEGLQKVYHKQNIIVRIYALADWFSPSDVEAPTLETVEFFERNTYKNIELEKVPTIIFSETMRDLDLAVSVAHVGGVDPEASLTTIEMRKALVRESLRLLKIENAKVEGNFTQIKGSLGEYRVHLGSAMVYKQATGAINIIPVHSQHRGKIFLPFMDEDPRTAEIVSKILMLAQDQKIKDPYILEQLVKSSG